MTLGRRLVGAVVVGLLTLPGMAASAATESAQASAVAAPADLAVIVPLVAPAGSPSIIGADSLAAWTAAGGLLADRLAAVQGTVATLAIDPRITASIRLLGSDAPESATNWLTTLLALPNESFALGWADADVHGLAAIGRADLTAPSSLQFAVDAARFPQEAVSPTPDLSAPPSVPSAGPSSEPADSAGPAVPTDEQLLALPTSLAARWATDGSIVMNDAAHPTVSAVPTGDTVQGPLVVALSRLVTESTGSIAPLLQMLGSDERVRLVPLSEITPTGSAPLLDDERRQLLERVATTTDAEARVASVTPDPSAFLDERRLDMLTALAVGGSAIAPDEEEAFIEESLAVRNAVQIGESSDLLVLSNTTGLPVTIINRLDVPVTVHLDAQPLRPLLRIQGVPREVALEPGSSQTVYLSAQAVTNGSVDVLTVLRNGSGQRIGPERVLKVDLQAQWEAVGIVILVLLAMVFAAGIANSIVTRRRAARAEAATDD